MAIESLERALAAAEDSGHPISESARTRIFAVAARVGRESALLELLQPELLRGPVMGFLSAVQLAALSGTCRSMHASHVPSVVSSLLGQLSSLPKPNPTPLQLHVAQVEKKANAMLEERNSFARYAQDGSPWFTEILDARAHTPSTPPASLGGFSLTLHLELQLGSAGFRRVGTFTSTSSSRIELDREAAATLSEVVSTEQLRAVVFACKQSTGEMLPIFDADYEDHEDDDDDFPGGQRIDFYWTDVPALAFRSAVPLVGDLTGWAVGHTSLGLNVELHINPLSDTDNHASIYLTRPCIGIHPVPDAASCCLGCEAGNIDAGQRDICLARLLEAAFS
jgi:hypothetical protein